MAALSIAPSEYWEGNDGPWSTFNVNIGTPIQQMRVLPATSQSSTWVVLEQGCTTDYPANCPTLRGNIFTIGSSDVSWTYAEPSNQDAFFMLPFASESTLPNYTANGEVGFDALTLDWSGKEAPKAPLQDQTIAGYAAPNPWLGILGLSGRPSHLFSASSSQNSTLQTLQTNKNVPGLYWAYTAGKPYANPPVYGSLTFGGYDAARVNMSSALQVPFGSDSTRDLLLAVTNILISGQSTPVPGLGIMTLIDSVVPEIWLPLKACEAFESALGLVWDDSVQMYLVNDSLHATLQSQKPTVTFFLAENSSSTSNTPVSVTLPYAAFDLVAQAPLAGIQDNSTSLRYFPLKRAANSTQYYLGRTFLQEAYVTADYDKGIFTVAQAQVPAAQTTTLVTVHPPGHHTGLKTGAIAGIAVGAVAAVALIAGLLFWMWWRRRKTLRQKRGTDMSLRTASIGDVTMVDETELPERDHIGYYKPPMSPPAEDENYFKPELDAMGTATGFVGQQTERHELDAGSVRPGHRSGLSWGSAGSGVSPVVGENRIRSSFGEPSPPMHPSGSPSPPLSGRRHSRHHSYGMYSATSGSPPPHGRHHSAGSPRGLFEMQ